MVIECEKLLSGEVAFGTLKEIEKVIEEMTVEQICKALGKNVKIIK
jgi:hypothetical protein